MSHFSLLLATEQLPTDEVLTKALQPYHEFECTGINDEFVQDVDVTQEMLAVYQRTMDERYRDKSVHHDPRDTQTFEEFLENEGFPCTTVPLFDSNYCLFDDDRREVVRVIRRTNPQAKWDYWRVGGRYAGRLIAKPESSSWRAPLSWEWKYDQSKPCGDDICQKRGLDLVRMQQARAGDRRKYVLDLMLTARISSVEILAEAINAARRANEAWNLIPEPRPRGVAYRQFVNEVAPVASNLMQQVFDIDDLPRLADGQTIDDWIQAAAPLSAYATLVNGKWSEKGEMGWWACVANEKPDWEQEFQRIFDEIPADHWLTMIDCHI